MTTTTLTAELMENLTALAADYDAVPVVLLAQSMSLTVAEIAAELKSLRADRVVRLNAIGRGDEMIEQYGSLEACCVEGENEWFATVELR